MVKVLICGDVESNFELVLSRVNTLQNSAHGPFQVLFFSGKLFKDAAEFELVAPTLIFPMKAYSFDRTGVTDGVIPPENNLEFFNASGVGLATVSNLTVGFMNKNADPESIQDAKDITNLVGYRGCDLLLTSNWPRETHHFLEEADRNILIESGVGLGIGLQEVSSFATSLRPRYHFGGGQGTFFQRTPYRNKVNASGNSSPCTRFIGLGKVSTSKDKMKKWMHALSLEPIVHMSKADVSAEPEGTTECPYVEVGSTVQPSFSAPQMKKSNFDDSLGAKSMPQNNSFAGKFDKIEDSFRPSGGAFFFGNKGINRDGTGNNHGGAAPNLTPPSDTATVLFIGGLTRELSDSELRNALPNSVSVRRPEGKSFAFVEFSTHAAAKSVVEASVRRGIMVQGRTISIGWGKERDKAPREGLRSMVDGGAEEGQGQGQGHQMDLDPPSLDAKTLFVGGLNPAITRESLLEFFTKAIEVRRLEMKAYAFVEFDSHETAEDIVKQSVLVPYVLDGAVLTVGWAKGSDEISNGKRKFSALDSSASSAGSGGSGSGGTGGHLLLTPPNNQAKTLFVRGIAPTVSVQDLESFLPPGETVSVRRPEGKDFAFIEFSCPNAARVAIESCSGESIAMLHGSRLTFGWAKGKPADKAFPSSHQADCWFCLASPSVKAHLVVSVAEHTYLAIPRGGISPMHVLISPIECVPSRTHLSTAAKSDLLKFESAIDKLYRSTDCSALKFERAVRTQGRDHMQEQCIPIPSNKISQALPIFLQQASTANLKFSEIQDNRDVDEVVLTMPGGPYQEYFYIQIPLGTEGKSRRFVYVQEDGRSFPMQFGTQVAANILGQPERALWKNCVLSEKEEIILAEKFRKSFEDYDFTS